MASIFHKILCPVDLDANASSALNLAAGIARAVTAEVYVLHVVPLVVQAAEVPMLINYKEQQERANARLTELIAKHVAGVRAIAETAVGEPAPKIIATARKLPADLTIMSTHGRRGFFAFLPG